MNGSTYIVGEKIKFSTYKSLLIKALDLSAAGYGVGILGYHDMYENILTILQVPEEDKE